MKNKSYHLTEKHKKTIQYIATLSGTVYLFESPSLEGKSWTLRWQNRWTERGRWGTYLRSQSSMIFSIVIPYVHSSHPEYKEKEARFNAMAKEAKELFNKLRKNK